MRLHYFARDVNIDIGGPQGFRGDRNQHTSDPPRPMVIRLSPGGENSDAA